jgi:CheY-like chemotaxis protein
VSATNSSRPTVLVVEDVEWIRDGMKRSLGVCGYRVVEAAAGAEAIAVAERENPQFILTEEEVPDFHDLMRRLREHPALSRVPVAIINPDAEENARYYGAHVLTDVARLQHLPARPSRLDRRGE